ncbi:MAG: LacI family DNA-binding transcriptional regulator [Clostridia bacterium]|nr:LacI family DNA-binding transcriptional regulator [Clostridia bacterium]
MRGATIKDVAKSCGISVSTVSRVLNDRPDVNPATREKVQSAIRELAFVPNNSARNLVKTETANLAVIVRGFNNPFFARLLKAVETDVYNSGYAMVLHHIDSSADEIMAAAMLAAEKRLCGVMFMGGRFDYAPKELNMLSVPYVCVTYTNTFGSLADTDYASVAIDDYREAWRAVEYLYERGHRRIAAIVSGKADRSVSELRYRGYRDALLHFGIEPDEALVRESKDFSLAGGYRATQSLLESGADFTALFVIADTMAVAAIKALRDNGRRVPEDCSLISIDGLDISAYVDPVLTTLEQPAEDIAHAGVKLLIGLMEGTGGNAHSYFPAILREGGSVRELD